MKFSVILTYVSDCHGNELVDGEDPVRVDVKHLSHRILIHDRLHLIVEEFLS